jgi:hypothetical protein
MKTHTDSYSDDAVAKRNPLSSFYAALGLAIAGLLLAAGAQAAKPARIDLCHVPTDNPSNVRLIGITGRGGALVDHLAHGDWMASEEKCDAIADNNCDGAPDPDADDADCAAQLGGNATCMDGRCMRGSSTPIGTILADILRGGNPPGSDRGVESAAGNLVADAQLYATAANGAQIAFVNPGSVRSDLIYAESIGEGDGVVTFGEAFTFQPFGNRLLTFPMTGLQIVNALQDQCQPSGLSRPFLHLGVSRGFTYDLSRTIVGNDCTGITVSNVKLNGMPLEPAGSYLVTVNSFIAGGGDNFETFQTSGGEAGQDGGSDLDAIVDYLSAFGPVEPPPTDRVNELP